MSLFNGRTDVYAHRFYSKKKEHWDYAPVCTQFWKSGCARKEQRDTPCRECPIRAFEELTPFRIRVDHLENTKAEGRDAVGMYAMRQDETCGFLAIDFDEASFQHDVLVVAGIARSMGFSMAVERSRSGQGAHAWLFFEQPIPAVLARNLGKIIITKACKQTATVKFDSYDRMFPSQDYMPSGNFGNLILLPLLKSARLHNNCCFVDNDFVAYPDQWAFLSSLKRATQQQVWEAVTAHPQFLGDFGLTTTNTYQDAFTLSPEELDEPTRKTIIPLDPKKDIKAPVVLYYSTGITLDKRVFSNKALDQFRRLASFKNPQYMILRNLKKQISYQNTPMIISCYEENQKVLWLPRGCRDSLLQLFEHSHIQISEEDHTTIGKEPIKATFIGTLYDYQQQALDKLCQHDTGILAAGTSFGKTVVAAAYIAYRNIPTLIIVPSKTLVQQWKERLNQFLNVPTPIQDQKKRKKQQSPFGTFEAGKDKRSGKVDIATLQSLSAKKRSQVDWIAPEFLNEYGLIIMDECHHGATDSATKVLQNCSAKYVLGLSATVRREDRLEPITFLHCGPIRYEYQASTLAMERNIQQHLLPRFLPFRKPVSISDADWTVQNIITWLTGNEERNDMIINDIQEALSKGQSPLVLTHRVDHVLELERKLRLRGIPAQAIHGKMSSTERKSIIQTQQGGTHVLIATGKLIGEGVDIPKLDTLFLTTPHSWEGLIHQYTGRIARSYEDKTDIWVYDYVDINIGICSRMYHKRLQAYQKLGYNNQLPNTGNTTCQQTILFTPQTMLEPIINDIKHSSQSIYIQSPSIKLTHQTKLILEALKEKHHITRVETLPTTARPLNEFKQQGVSITQHISNTQHLMICDQKIVWYGNTSILDMHPDTTMMRIEDSTIAKELSKAIGKGETQQELF